MKTTFEGEVGHETTGTIFHPNTNVLTVGCHLEVEVDQGSGLGN
ncbi:unnamed protein product, partial [Allacma fusca]